MNDGTSGKKIVKASMPIEDARELVLAIAINTAAIENVLDRHGQDFDRVERVNLETAAMFGEAMVSMLSQAVGFTDKDLERGIKSIAEEISNIHNSDTNNLFVHANKSKNGKDIMIERVFGKKDT